MLKVPRQWGCLAGRYAVAEIARPHPCPWFAPIPPRWVPSIHHITGGAEAKTFQPMNVNFGLFHPVDGLKGGRKGRKDRYKAYTDRAKACFSDWLAQST